MIITNNRENLDNSLNDKAATIFILIGSTESDAGVVHTVIETKKWDTYQHWFLFPDAALLTSSELTGWFNGKTAQSYVVLGGENLPKTIAQKGPINDLLKSNGKPDYLKIREIFLMGDEV